MGERVHWVPAAPYFNLSAACRIVNEALDEHGYGCYHVGSSLTKPDYRDVDVRFIMADEDFARFFGDDAANVHLNALWCLMCTSIGVWLSKQSGLPVDFQIQQMTASQNEEGERHPLGVVKFLKPHPAAYGKDPQ